MQRYDKFPNRPNFFKKISFFIHSSHLSTASPIVPAKPVRSPDTAQSPIQTILPPLKSSTLIPRKAAPPTKKTRRNYTKVSVSIV